MRRALLWTALNDRAVITIEPREAQAPPPPALALRSASIRAGHLGFARISGESGLAHALAALAMAGIGAFGAIRVGGACCRRGAIWPLPSGMAEATSIGAHPLRRDRVGGAIVGAFDRESAILAIVPRVAEAPPMAARPPARAMMWALTPSRLGAVGPEESWPAVAAAVFAHPVAVAVGGAFERLGAVLPRPLRLA